MGEARLSVTVILPSLAGGGAERVSLNLAMGLRRHADVRLVLLDDAGPLRVNLPSDMAVTSLGRARLRNGLLPLVQLLRRHPTEVIFSSLGHVNLALAAMRSWLPGKLVLREANMPDQSLPHGPFPAMLKTAYRMLYRRADLVLATSDLMYRQLRSYGVPDARLALLRNPVDVEHLRRLAGVGHPPLRYIAAGRLVYQKGFDRLIPLLAGIKEAHLTILGDGPERHALEALAKQYGLPLDLPGFVADAAAWYAAADAFLLPSRWEGMPNVVLEALACGVPVIATPEAGGIADIAAEVPHAVSVVPFGAQFREAAERVVRHANSTLRDNLLPKDYELEAVITRFHHLIGNLARKS